MVISKGTPLYDKFLLNLKLATDISVEFQTFNKPVQFGINSRELWTYENLQVLKKYQLRTVEIPLPKAREILQYYELNQLETKILPFNDVSDNAIFHSETEPSLGIGSIGKINSISNGCKRYYLGSQNTYYYDRPIHFVAPESNITILDADNQIVAEDSGVNFSNVDGIFDPWAVLGNSFTGSFECDLFYTPVRIVGGLKIVNLHQDVDTVTDRYNIEPPITIPNPEFEFPSLVECPYVQLEFTLEETNFKPVYVSPQVGQTFTEAYAARFWRYAHDLTETRSNSPISSEIEGQTYLAYPDIGVELSHEVTYPRFVEKHKGLWHWLTLYYCSVGLGWRVE